MNLWEWPMAVSASPSFWLSENPAGDRDSTSTITTKSYTSWKAAQSGRSAMLIVRAGVPHKFVDTGDGPLRQIDIHLNAAFETVWLED